MMFRLFENALDPTEKPAETQPPASLIPFYWHFARQAKGLFVALFVTGLHRSRCSTPRSRPSWARS